MTLGTTVRQLRWRRPAAKQKSFATREEAVKAAIAAAKTNDEKELLAIYGAHAKELLSSGDAAADKQRRERFLAPTNEKVSIAAAKAKTASSRSVKTNGRFPFRWSRKPMVGCSTPTRAEKKSSTGALARMSWTSFRSSLGLRRCPARIRDESARRPRDFSSTHRSFAATRAKKTASTGKRKRARRKARSGGLSPEARSEGYKASDKPVPYHGYYYKILTAQGKDAPGGAYSYFVKGKMIGGFALVAYPAAYGNSGVMTFHRQSRRQGLSKRLGQNYRGCCRGDEGI